MKISHEPPDCMDALTAAFGAQWQPGVIITYAGTIHSHDEHIAPDYLVHELVHVQQQQGKDPVEYLLKYIQDPHFRLSVETAAYKVQAAFIRATVYEPEEVYIRIHNLCKIMAKTHGNILTYEQAQALLS